MAQIPQQRSYGIPALDYSGVSNTLAALGQQIGQGLAMREYQRQATAVLPAMQANYRQAFDDINQGRFADGYMKMMETNLQFGADQNPFLANAAQQATEMLALAGKQTQSEMWRMQQAGGGGGGVGLPAMTQRERAANILLGEGQNVDVNLPEDQVDLTENTTPDYIPSDTQTEEPSISDKLNFIAQGAQSPKYKQALQDVAKNRPPEELLNEMRSFNQKYLELDTASKMSLNESLTKRLGSRQELANLSKDKAYYKIDGAERIIGKGIDGLYLKPSEEALGATIGKNSDSVRYGTNLEALQNIQKVAAGAVSELNSGKIGDFISNQGGAFNVAVEYFPNEDDEDVPYLVNKNNPDVRMKIAGGEKRTAAISLAIDNINTIPPSLDRLNARGATASMIGFQTPKSEGPTRSAAAGLPAMQQPKFTEGKVYSQGGKKYRYTQGQFVAID